MPRDEHNTIADQFICYCHGLFRVAGVIGDQQFNLLTEHTTSRVYVRDSHLGALLNLFTPKNIRSGERTSGGDQDLCMRRNQVERS